MLRRHAITLIVYTDDPDPDTAEGLARASVWPLEPSRVVTKAVVGARSVPVQERGMRVYGGDRRTIEEIASQASAVSRHAQCPVTTEGDRDGSTKRTPS